MKLLLPKEKLTDKFGYRNLEAWHRYGGGYRVFHFGTDYRTGPLLCPCDAIVYGEHKSEKDARGTITYIIPLDEDTQEPVDHTIITIFHRQPPEPQWVFYNKGDIITKSISHYGVGGPHTHLEIDCTPDSPLCREANIGMPSKKQWLIEGIVEHGVGQGAPADKVLKKAQWQARVDKIIEGNCVLENSWLLSGRWAPDRLCKVSKVGRKVRGAVRVIRINPEVFRC